MIPSPARYLLRFDDLCPTVHRENWRRFYDMIGEFGLQPILAIVPENYDLGLCISPPDPAFWSQMRDLQAGGATVALHGYRHLCASCGHSLLGLSSASEFAGIPAETQREWIHAGCGILRACQLHPRIFVAPRHGFDVVTLQALRAEGIGLVSDGFARSAFLREGLTWIPQQVWGPVDKARGIWTICIHPNTASTHEIENLRVFLRAHASQFSSVDRLLAEFPPSTLTPAESIYARVALWRVKASRARSLFPRVGRGFSSSA